MPTPNRSAMPALALALIGFLVVAGPASAYHLGLAEVHRETVEGAGAYGASVELAERGTLEFVLNGYGETTSTPISHGAALYDEDGYVGMVVVTAHRSPNRVHVETSPTGVIVSPDQDRRVSVETHGEIGRSGELDLTLRTTEQAAEEPTIRSFVALHGAEAGMHEAIVWLGEAEETELVVRADATIEALTTQAGRAHVAGDPDMEHALVDAQFQESFVAGSIPLEEMNALGATAMVQASVDADVDRELHGVWGVSERKHACLGEPACASTTEAYDACRLALDVDCGPVSLSWSNETTGGQAQGTYVFHEDGPGSYTFTVDRKLDAYAVGGPGFTWQPNHAYLSVADVGLPR